MNLVASHVEKRDGDVLCSLLPVMLLVVGM
jgi:hypothetical protein